MEVECDGMNGMVRNPSLSTRPGAQRTLHAMAQLRGGLHESVVDARPIPLASHSADRDAQTWDAADWDALRRTAWLQTELQGEDTVQCPFETGHLLVCGSLSSRSVDSGRGAALSQGRPGRQTSAQRR